MARRTRVRKRPLARERAWRKWEQLVRRRNSRREDRKAGFVTINFDRPMRRRTFWNRLDKVKDPKTAFFYLLDNISGSNSGKLLSDMASRGEYHWVERDRGTDQSYYIVRRRGNHIVVTQRKWMVNGSGVNTFMGSLIGYDETPTRVDTVILRHPVMDVAGFRDAYKAAAPDLGVWDK